jgi:hypothetical protein
MQTPRSPPIASSRIALVDRDNPHKEVRFARDSPLEQRGFEPLVPRKNGWPVLTALIDLKALLLRENRANSREGDRQFESPLLQRGVCLSGEPQRCRRQASHFGGGLRVAGDVRREELATTRLFWHFFSDGH